MTEKAAQQYAWDWYKAENRAISSWLKAEKQWKHNPQWGPRWLPKS